MANAARLSHYMQERNNVARFPLASDPRIADIARAGTIRREGEKTMEDLTIAPADMTDQQVFDEVVRRLAAQGRPGYDAENGRGRYETGDGCRCAIGVLLKRKQLDAIRLGNYDDAGVDSLPPPIVQWLGVLRHQRLLDSLQAEHDHAAENGWSSWREAFRDVAEKHGLDASALDEPGAP